MTTPPLGVRRQPQSPAHHLSTSKFLAAKRRARVAAILDARTTSGAFARIHRPDDGQV